MNKEDSISLTEKTIILMLGKGGGFAIAFLIPIVLVRFFDANEFGTYKQFFVVYGTLFSIGQIGLVQSVFYFVPDNKGKFVYITQCYFILVLVGLVFLLGLSMLSGTIASLLNNPIFDDYIIFVGLFLCFMLGASFLEGLLISESKIKYASVILFLNELCKAAFMIVPLLLTRRIISIFIGVVLFSLIRFLFATFYIREYVVYGWKQINSESIRVQLRYALPLGISVLFVTLSANLHNYFVSFYFSPDIFAIFAVGVFVPPIIEVIESPVVEPMFVEIVRNIRDKNEGGVLRVWHNSVRKLSLGFFPIIAFCFVESRQIINLLFTENYSASIPIFMIAIYRTIFGVFIPDNIIKGYGETKYVLRAHFISLMMNFLILFILIKCFGLIGAAVGLILNEFMLKSLLVNKARVLLNLRIGSCLPWAHLGGSLMISYVSTVPVIIYNYLFPGIGIINIAVCLIVFLMTYSILLLKSPLLTVKEREGILKYVKDNGYHCQKAWNRWIS